MFWKDWALNNDWRKQAGKNMSADALLKELQTGIKPIDSAVNLLNKEVNRLKNMHSANMAAA